MLGLCHCHAVTGHEGYRLGRFQNQEGVFGNNWLHFALNLGRLLHGTEARKQYMSQGAVHGLTHDIGKDDASSAHHGARYDQNVVVDGKTRSTRG